MFWGEKKHTHPHTYSHASHKQCARVFSISPYSTSYSQIPASLYVVCQSLSLFLFFLLDASIFWAVFSNHPYYSKSLNSVLYRQFLFSSHMKIQCLHYGASSLGRVNRQNINIDAHTMKEIERKRYTCARLHARTHALPSSDAHHKIWCSINNVTQCFQHVRYERGSEIVCACVSVYYVWW